MSNTAMNWEQLMSPVRFAAGADGVPQAEVRETDPHRSDFHVDYDRVVFSGAFRRLGRKTQVHPLAQNDHTHNRLTHSVEVASVGRSLGLRAGGMLADAGRLPGHISPQDLGTAVQVACLAHDLGNPPFGHTGEDALRAWFGQPENEWLLHGLSPAEAADIRSYEGNAHSLRQAVSLEMHRNRGGMRLTAASLGALIKYPWTSSRPEGRKKFSIYQTELPYIRAAAQVLGLPQQGADCWARHPLSYLMEAADDICYALMDLEDAVDLDLLDPHEVEAVLAPLVPAETLWHVRNPRERPALMRGLAIGQAVDEAAQTFVRHQDDLLNGSYRGKDLLDLCGGHVQSTLSEAKKLARDRVFRHRSKLVTELAAFPCLGTVLALLVPAARRLVCGAPLSVRDSLALELPANNPVTREDSLYTAYMKILDFVGGMTDNYAARTARELSGTGIA